MRPIQPVHGLVLSLLVAACGDNLSSSATVDAHPADAGQVAKRFAHLVTFGDSLSDVGTYKVGTIATLGGGKYTVNGLAPGIWVEQLAAKLGLEAPCAAETGLDGDPTKGFSVAVADHAGCLNYAQGGARVTSPVGPGNKALGGAAATLGQLTIPVTKQLDHHLMIASHFAPDDLVTVIAGANDLFINLAQIGAGAGQISPDTAVANMAQAGDELARLIRVKIVAKGASHVVVLAVPDVSLTPFALSQTAQTQGLIKAMTQTFNDALTAGLAPFPNQVLLVDTFTSSEDQSAHPSTYGITNVGAPACDLSAAKNPLSSSLVCSTQTLITGDTSKYLFADGVHPTPFGHSLLLKAVNEAMTTQGWM
jgi:phospholipase/lecithinase/hemolysin